jgi:hypothetical protein
MLRWNFGLITSGKDDVVVGVLKGVASACAAENHLAAVD